MKKIFYSILVFLLILLNFSTVCADDVDNEVDFEDTIEVTASNVSELPKTNSRRYIVYDRISKSMIIGKNEDIKSAMASTTKRMPFLRNSSPRAFAFSSSASRPFALAVCENSTIVSIRLSTLY